MLHQFSLAVRFQCIAAQLIPAIMKPIISAYKLSFSALAWTFSVFTHFLQKMLFLVCLGFSKLLIMHLLFFLRTLRLWHQCWKVCLWPSSPSYEMKVTSLYETRQSCWKGASCCMTLETSPLPLRTSLGFCMPSTLITQNK